jgi:hypothetical protein
MIFAAIFLCLLAVLLYRFRLSRETSLRESLKLLPVFFLLGIFIFITGLFSHFSCVAYRDQAALSPTETVQAFHALKNRSAVMVSAVVSRSNEPVLEDFAAYYATRDNDDDYFERKTPCLWLSLSDGEVRLDNDDYTLWNWHYRAGAYSYQFLKAGDKVVVYGAVQDTVGLKDRKKERFLDADFVFAGSLEDCRARLKRKSTWPQIESYASMALGTGVCLIPLLYVLILSWKKRSS